MIGCIPVSGLIEKIGKDRPWSITVARGLATPKDAPVEEAIGCFETATSAKSKVVAGLAWLELGWFHKDRNTSPDRSAVLENARRSLEEASVAVASAEIAMVPKSTVGLGEKEAVQTLRLLDRLEELDDVTHVYSNGDFPDSALDAYSAQATAG